METKEKYNITLNEYYKLIDELMATDKDNLTRIEEIKCELNIIKTRLLDLYEDICLEQYENCKHVYLITGYADDGRPIETCLKCGLTTDAMNHRDKPIYRVMNRYFYSHFYNMNGKNISYNLLDSYDLEKAKKVYKAILKNYPDISDDELVKVFRRWHIKKENNTYKELKRSL